MVFDDKSRIMEFPLTQLGRNWWRSRKFLSQGELLDRLGNWWYNATSGLTLTNIICDEFGPVMKQESWYRTGESDKFFCDLMEVSLTHGIIYFGKTLGKTTLNDCFAVARSANNGTNISGEFMEALIRKVEEGNEWLRRHTQPTG